MRKFLNCPHGSPFRSCLFLAVFSGLLPTELWSQDESLDAQTSVQIVNATSVPIIALSQNGKADYPDFPQGLRTADAPTNRIKVKYTAVDKQSGASADSPEIKYTPNANQSLVILGDFSTSVPPETFPQPGQPQSGSEKPFLPNVHFRVYKHTKGTVSDSVRLRVINGMPGKTLSFDIDGAATDQGQQFTLKPGEERDMLSQAPVSEYVAEIDGTTIPILMRQEGEIRNAMLIFFLKADGKPAFTRAFENVQP